ncbi:hypothetical protein GcM3_018042, partial [Golovinomyces cichoracearum]
LALEEDQVFTLHTLGLPAVRHNWGNTVPDADEVYDAEEQAEKAGPGGAGKTYTYETICSAARGMGGHTPHSRFGIPLDLSPDFICSIKKQSNKAAYLKTVDMIVWDEIICQDKFCFEAVHRLFCDLRDVPDDEKAVLFGEGPAVMGGDFAQTLPIKPGGSRPDIWVADLPYKVELHGLITLPPYIDSPPNIEALIESIYPADILIDAHTKSLDSLFKDRCLIATTNSVVWDLNDG